MARQPRKKSNTGIHHIMLRGIDKRNIFLDDGDRRKFINNLLKAKERSDFKLYAYCILNNHVHLLIKEGSEPIGESMKRITIGYVSWHNGKYMRTGHLFENRFKSQPIEKEDEFFRVLRYIHQNPLKAGIVSRLEDYQWCSYRQYLNLYNGFNYFIDTDLVTSYFQTIESFKSYTNTKNDDEYLVYKPVLRYTDDKLRNEILSKYIIDEIVNLPTKERNVILKKIYNEFGVSIVQLSRVIGVGRGIVQRAVKPEK